MIAKKTVKNQITLPKAIVEQFPSAVYFEVRVEAGAIVLRPVEPGRADAVRRKLESLGITESDIGDAVAWARERGA